ncbi:MAG: hypothetical protein QOI10_4682, partial [Solirubrobacterales bacterium]|nr:hypothetical protein [Solirubrobacterales bacterium]
APAPEQAAEVADSRVALDLERLGDEDPSNV